jgi:hypothetical protein
MAKAEFNGVCEWCRALKPRCAVVEVRSPIMYDHGRTIAVCDKCRKRYRGRYRLAEAHRSGGKA